MTKDDLEFADMKNEGGHRRIYMNQPWGGGLAFGQGMDLCQSLENHEPSPLCASEFLVHLIMAAFGIPEPLRHEEIEVVPLGRSVHSP